MTSNGTSHDLERMDRLSFHGRGWSLLRVVWKGGVVRAILVIVSIWGLLSLFFEVSAFVVNRQGRPFMVGLTENTPLLSSQIATFFLTFMFASESIPGLNRYF